jgi:penicillin amidase
VVVKKIHCFDNYVIRLNKSSVIDDYQNLDLDGLIEKVSVSRNPTTGINRVEATNEKDAYYILGYLHAKDRLFQMDINRRIIQGKLSEVLGEDFLQSDLLFRSLGFKEIINLNSKKIDYKTKIILQSYSDGINEFIKLNNKKLHIGFTIYDYKPELWKVEDCISLQRLFALNFSVGFKLDIIMGQIAEKISISQALELIPEAINNPPYIYQEVNTDTLKKKNRRKYSVDFIHNNKSLTNDFESYKNGIDFVANNFGLFKNLYGCNSFAVKKDDKINDAVILANDFHSSITLPSMWYQVQVSYSNEDIAGLTLPGIPFVIIGRNNQIAWGLSNAMIDDCDYFMEKLTPDKKYFFRQNEQKKIRFVKDTIKIKDKEQHIYYLSKLNNTFLLNKSSAISNLQDKNSSVNQQDVQHNELNFTWKWTGQEVSDELNSYYKISKAKNFDEFKKAFAHYGTPFSNYIYADKHGNFAQISVGRVPKRNSNNTLLIPNPAWMDEYQWYDYGVNGIYRMNYNPSNQYVVSSNNCLSKSFKNYYFDLPYRAARLESMINEFLSIENYVFEKFDAQRMQMDVLSNYSLELINEIKPIFEKNWDRLSFKEQKLLGKLFYWDNLFSPNKIQPSFFNLFMKRMIINTFQDEIGEKNLNNLMNYYQFLYGKLLQIIRMKQSPWFDNVNTNDVETRAYIIISSFREALTDIENLYQSDNPDKWLFSEFHQVTPENFLSQSKLLKPVTQVSSLIIGGDFTTIMRTEWNLNEPFKVSLAPSARLIMDLSDNSIQYSFPGGSSSEPMSQFYSNQLHLWENGGYISYNLKKSPSNENEIFLNCY